MKAALRPKIIHPISRKNNLRCVYNADRKWFDFFAVAFSSIMLPHRICVLLFTLLTGSLFNCKSIQAEVCPESPPESFVEFPLPINWKDGLVTPVVINSQAMYDRIIEDRKDKNWNGPEQEESMPLTMYDPAANEDLRDFVKTDCFESFPKLIRDLIIENSANVGTEFSLNFKRRWAFPEKHDITLLSKPFMTKGGKISNGGCRFLPIVFFESKYLRIEKRYHGKWNYYLDIYSLDALFGTINTLERPREIEKTYVSVPEKVLGSLSEEDRVYAKKLESYLNEIIRYFGETPLPVIDYEKSREGFYWGKAYWIPTLKFGLSPERSSPQSRLGVTLESRLGMPNYTPPAKVFEAEEHSSSIVGSSRTHTCTGCHAHKYSVDYRDKGEVRWRKDAFVGRIGIFTHSDQISRPKENFGLMLWFYFFEERYEIQSLRERLLAEPELFGAETPRRRIAEKLICRADKYLKRMEETCDAYLSKKEVGLDLEKMPPPKTLLDDLPPWNMKSSTKTEQAENAAPLSAKEKREKERRLRKEKRKQEKEDFRRKKELRKKNST